MGEEASATGQQRTYPGARPPDRTSQVDSSGLRLALNSIASGRTGATVPADRVGGTVTAWPARHPRVRQRRRRCELDHLHATLDAVDAAGVPGDLVTCGLGRGASVAFMSGYADARDWRTRHIWAVDAPAPVGTRTTTSNGNGDGAKSAVAERVHDVLERHGVDADQVQVVEGTHGRAADDAITSIAVLHVDARRVRAVADVLERFHGRIVPGGYVVVQGADETARTSVEQFRASHGGIEVPKLVTGSRLVWRVPEAELATSGGTSR